MQNKINISKIPYTFNRLNVSSAWMGLEYYIPSIIKELNIQPRKCLEFGIDKGYSSYIFSQLFDKTIGVDLFAGDDHIIHEQGEKFYEQVCERFEKTNVSIVRSDFRDFIKNNNDEKYDLIHIDIVHYYQETYECAEWAIQHSDVVILHDTESFPDIKRVCEDISKKYGVNFYNIIPHHGLGILYRDVD